MSAKAYILSFILTLFVSANCYSQSADPNPVRDTDEVENTPDIKHKKRSDWAYPTEFIIGSAINLGATEIMKNKIHELRPNGENFESMPSRHTSWMFTATTLLSIELSYRTPWVALVSYAAGSAMGIERVMSRNHYPGDVFAGAALGTSSGVIGYMITNLAFGRQHNYPGIANIYFDYTPYISVETGAQFPTAGDFGDVRLGTGIYTSLRGIVPMGQNWGISGRLIVSSAPVKTIATDSFVAPLNRVGFLAGVNVEKAPHDWPVSFGAGAELGYMRTLNSSKMSLSKNSAMFRCNVSAAIPVTTSLTVALNGGYELSRQRIGTSARGLGAFTIDLSTRAYF